jgi:hypothetical protein
MIRVDLADTLFRVAGSLPPHRASVRGGDPGSPGHWHLRRLPAGPSLLPRREDLTHSLLRRSSPRLRRQWRPGARAGLAHAPLQNISARPTRCPPRAVARSDFLLLEGHPTGSRRIRPGARRERVPRCVSTPTASEATRASAEEEHRQALPTGETRRTGRQTPEMLLAGRAIRRAEGRVRLIPVTESPRKELRLRDGRPDGPSTRGPRIRAGAIALVRACGRPSVLPPGRERAGASPSRADRSRIRTPLASLST